MGANKHAVIPGALINLLREDPITAVLTGAGISAESGVPTFREAQTGLWAQFDPQELATPQAFQKDPKLVWGWYQWRRELVNQAAPNLGHHALVVMEAQLQDFRLITQNIDNLHYRAGSGQMPGGQLVEFHGNIHRTKCVEENLVMNFWPEMEEMPPQCPRCGGLLRPDVVWFGESVPESAQNAALEAARTCQVFFSIGTSTVVEPAASLPFIALQNKAFVVEVNPEPTPLTPYADVVLPQPAGNILPELVRLVWGIELNV